MTRVPADRSHLSIGEVLSLLQDEFPDVTISKIRFLESQGLLDPERTPSGYRKFYETDIERLRWILRQQKEHYLPLKVIKDRLDDRGPPPPDDVPARQPAGQPVGRGAAGAGHRPGVGPGADGRPTPAARSPVPPGAGAGAGAGASAAAVAGSTAPVAQALLDVDDRPVTDRPAARADEPAGRPAPRGRPAPAGRAGGDAPSRENGAAPVPAPPRPPAPSPPVAARTAPPAEAGFEPGAASVSLTIDELAEASDVSVADLRDLERFGLLESHAVGDATYYDGDALVVARTAGGFLQHGIQARHLRTYKVAVDRETGLFEQIVLPLLKQRNPEAHRRAARTIAELVHLGEVMRGVLLRRELRDHGT